VKPITAQQLSLSTLISTNRPLRRILTSRDPVMVFFRFLLAGSAGFLALASLWFSIQALFPPIAYKKDFLQEYLMARAVLNGVSPYLPLNELALTLMGDLPVPIFPHATPHPPPVVFVSLPFGLLTYLQAATLWFVLEVAGIFIALYCLSSTFQRKPGRSVMVATICVALMWNPVKDELIVGQFMTLFLLLMIGAWKSLRAERDGLGGVLLGCVIALKLMAWPLILFLAWRRRWRAVAAAGLTALAGNLAAGFIIGFDQIIYYYTVAGKAVVPMYESFERNISLWTIGNRLFKGTYSEISLGIEAPPLVLAPAIAPYFSIGIPLLFLLLGLWLAFRAGSFDGAFGILACVSLLVNPVAWSHYLVLAFIPITILIHLTMEKNGLKKWEITALLGVAFILFESIGLRTLLFLALGEPLNSQTPLHVSFAASLVTLLPTVSILGLLGMIYHFDRSRDLIVAKEIA